MVLPQLISELSPGGVLLGEAVGPVQAEVEVAPPERHMASAVIIIVLHRHRGGRAGNINAWYLNSHMVYL